jgi:hypothetical protein
MASSKGILPAIDMYVMEYVDDLQDVVLPGRTTRSTPPTHVSIFLSSRLSGNGRLFSRRSRVDGAGADEIRPASWRGRPSCAVSTLLKVDLTRDGGLRSGKSVECSGASARISAEGKRLRQRGTSWKRLVPTALLSHSAAKKRAAEMRDEGGRTRLDAWPPPLGCARTRRSLIVSVRLRAGGRPFLRHFQQLQRPSSTLTSKENRVEDFLSFVSPSSSLSILQQGG